MEKYEGVMRMLHGDLHDPSTSSESESIDPNQPDILMDQTSQDCFDKEVFRDQLLLHLTSPFCIPFLLAAGKSTLLANTSLWPWENLSDFTWSVVPAFWYVNLLLFVLYNQDFAEANIYGSEIVFLPLGAILVHRSMIALKYSGLSQVEYQRWRMAPPSLAHRWSKQIQLLSSWLPLPDNVLEMEVQKACRIQGANLLELRFQHDVRCVNSLRAWKVWQQMSECSTEQLHGELPCQHGAMEDQRVTQGVQELSATEVLLTLWRMAIDHVVRFNRVRLVGFWALLPSCVPMIWRAVASSAEDTSRPDLILQAAFGRSPPVIYAVVTSALICYMHVFLAGLFAVMGIVHYKRMMMVLQSICRLTRPLFCVFPNLPQAQLSGRVGVENMRAVLACFEVTLRLGGRYQNRVEAYIATLASAATLGMSFIVVGVVIGVHNQMNSFTVVILSLNLGVTAIMFQMIWYGSKANENFGLLANNICRARWRNSVQKEDEDCEQVMSLAMERLAILCETEPVNIAGTVPTCDLGYSLLSVDACTWTWCGGAHGSGTQIVRLAPLWPL
ncbi:unnamed protein product [Durusdinium trenchii]|uniref:Uncharacterized protein n=1 Tax=Durusdinium trenchii TaxID=1381693 RepID=A0ABP0I7B2_9DINO